MARGETTVFVKNDPLNAVDPTGFKITVLGNDPALSQALANRDKKLNACNKPRSCKVLRGREPRSR